MMGLSTRSGNKTRLDREKERAGHLEAVTRSTLADSVYAQLRAAIIGGRLWDGAELKQVELAEQFGVSRVPVREALRRLQAERLVVAAPFQCFVVTSLNREQVMELLDLREALEVYALKQTLALPAREQRIREAKSAAKALTLSQDGETWLAADREFHRVLNGKTTAVAAIIEEIRERVHRYLYLIPPAPPRRRDVLREHAGLVAALEAGDVQALEETIRLHVRGTRRHLEEGFKMSPNGLDEAFLVDTGPAKL